MRLKVFDTPGCFELVKQGEGECSHAHIMVGCPKCGVGSSDYRGGMMGEIISPLPYRGAVDLKCDFCGFALRVYVDTDTGEVTLLGTRVCSRVSEG
ncbi:unnamed protein product [marine sediment metagenome]|uniref:Uncharacterized protein n=1 Tax=marine sediment metagenome TaxID=412755 RepID=X1RQD8_9ZZZZ